MQRIDQKRREKVGERRKVVITGMGVVSAIGHNIPAFARSLKEGTCGIRRLEVDSSFPLTLGAKLEDFNFEEKLQQYANLPEKFLKKTKKCARRAPLSVQTSILGALEAWEQAQLGRDGINPSNISLVVAGQNISPRYQYELMRKFQEYPEYLPPSYAIHFMDTDHVGTLSEVFKLYGEGYTVGGASASGNVGIIQGYRLVKFGLAEACLVVGALADLSPMEMQALYGIGAMGGKRFREQPAKACRPFDQEHEGFIYGQGSGCLILETEASAKNRGVPICGEMAGGAMSLDGSRLTDPNKAGEIGVMGKAMKEAGVEALEVDYLNTHGTSSPTGDKAEIAAVKTVFQETLAKVWINSTKCMTGHCLYSAGVIEAIATIIQMNKGFVHPNLNLENPIDQSCRFVGRRSERAQINVAMSNSFGFGGINTAIILKPKPQNL